MVDAVPPEAVAPQKPQIKGPRSESVVLQAILHGATIFPEGVGQQLDIGFSSIGSDTSFEA